MYVASRQAHPHALDPTFQIFSNEVIQKRIIDNGEVFRLLKLRDMFVDMVEAVKDTKLDKNNYKTSQLKKRIKKRFPELTYIKQSIHTSEIVLYNESKSNLILDLSNIDGTSDSEPDDVNTHNSGSRFYTNLSKTRDLYVSSQILKNSLLASKSLDSWPLTHLDISIEKVETIVPPELFNFIAWCSNQNTSNDEIYSDTFVSVKKESKLKILAICQDLIFLSSSGKKATPKHVGLSLAVRHLTGSSKIIDLLNYHGHCMSRSFTLEHDTALAQQQMLNMESIPGGFRKNCFTTLVWDNNDFGEETLSGKGTTHNTNGIIVQRKDSFVQPEVFSQGSISRTRKRRLSECDTHIEEYCPSAKRQGPPLLLDNDLQPLSDNTAVCPLQQDDDPQIQNQEIALVESVDKALYFAKFVQDNDPLPGWTGCNTLAYRTAPSDPHLIGYLPVIAASPTQMSTVYTLLKKTLNIAEALNLHEIVVVADQALYAKVQDIRWQMKEKFLNNIIVRLGQFHTCMSFLGVIGKRFGDAGLSDIFIESGVVAEGSMAGVISGHHYNRSMRSHKLVCDAFTRLQIEQFLDTLDESEKEQAIHTMQKLKESFPNNFHSHTTYEDFQNLLLAFNSHVKMMKQKNMTYAMWASYIDLVSLLLQFVRATREGNWILHLDTIKQMIPWFFAYGRINYSRYLPIYLKEMLDLKITNPNIHLHFLKGEFAVQRQVGQPFSMTACDQIIEQTLNRDSKTKGGIKGISLNCESVNRWVMSHSARSSIVSSLFQMADESAEHSTASELTNNRISKDEKDVKKIMGTIKAFGNPFDCGSVDKIIHLASGIEADFETAQSYMGAKEVGAKCFKEFHCKRLVDGSISLFAPIKIPKLKSFATMVAKQKSKKKMQSPSRSAKDDKELYMRLIVLAQEGKVNLEELMTYPLTAVPPALGHFDGSLRKTNKSVLIKCLEKRIPSCQKELTDLNKTATALVIDGMALIRQQKSSETFSEFARKVSSKIQSLAAATDSCRVDFVIDMYYKKSIKDCERLKRSTPSHVVRFLRKDQKMPNSISEFLSVNKNKEELLNMLWEEWLTTWTCSNIILVADHGNSCDIFSVLNGHTIKQNVPELSCDHEEADTRMFLHAQHAVRNGIKQIVLYTSDTDAIVIGASLYYSLNTDMYAFHCSASTSKVVSIGEIATGLNKNRSDALIGLHAFSGCDTVSSFLGKGKNKFLKHMLESDKWQQFFSEIGTSWKVPQSLQDQCEQVVCELYGWKGLSDVNIARHNCLKLTDCKDTTLPPNRDSLFLHLQRANYQAKIWRLSLCQYMTPPAPENSGWVLESTSADIETLGILWSTLPQAPAGVIEITMCSCKKTNCAKSSCSCVKNKMKCSSLCRCIDCKNIEPCDDALESPDCENNLFETRCD